MNAGAQTSGGVQDMMKTQIMSMGIMGNMMNKDGNGGDSVLMAIMGLVMLSFMEYFMKFLQEIGNEFKKRMKAKFEEKTKQYTDEIIVTDKKKPSASILFDVTEKNIGNNEIQSLLEYISNQNSAVWLRFNWNFYLIRNKEEFEIGFKDVTCKVNELTVNDEGKIDKLTFYLSSYEITLKEMKNWIKDLTDAYIKEKQNRIGDKRFFFNEIPVKIQKMQNGNINTNNLSPFISFSMTEFKTNKSLKNIYGPEIKPVKKMVDLFQNHPEWYEKRGIPHTLGLLFSGPPGTGKTSTIKAVAKDTDKHIFNIKLRPNTTQVQLNNLFFSEKIHIENEDGMKLCFTIPLDKRIYVLEDVDCLTDVVLSRKLKDGTLSEISSEVQSEKVEENKTNYQNSHQLPDTSNSRSNLPSNLPSKLEPFSSNDPFKNNFASTNGSMNISSNLNNKKDDKQESETDDILLNLSFLLNLFDGILETPNRILIMTSNYPERLDDALIRPGRIDLAIEFGKCKMETVKEMFYEFFELEYSEDNSRKFPFENDEFFSEKVTPAALSRILGMYYDDSSTAYENIVAKINEIDQTHEIKRIERNRKRELLELERKEQEEIETYHFYHMSVYKSVLKQMENIFFKEIEKRNSLQELKRKFQEVLEEVMKKVKEIETKNKIKQIVSNSDNQEISIPSMYGASALSNEIKLNNPISTDMPPDGIVVTNPDTGIKTSMRPDEIMNKFPFIPTVQSKSMIPDPKIDFVNDIEKHLNETGKYRKSLKQN